MEILKISVNYKTLESEKVLVKTISGVQQAQKIKVLTLTVYKQFNVK